MDMFERILTILGLAKYHEGQTSDSGFGPLGIICDCTQQRQRDTSILGITTYAINGKLIISVFSDLAKQWPRSLYFCF